jgi:hypothetical protein
MDTKTYLKKRAAGNLKNILEHFVTLHNYLKHYRKLWDIFKPSEAL